jgi:hypothetical protein
MTFEEAKTWIKQLNLAGHNDWRLPTLEEAMSLVEPKSSKYQSSKFGYFINPIFANKPCEIWTADQMKGGSGAWIVHFLLGVCYYSDSDFITASAVRAVRSAQSSKD